MVHVPRPPSTNIVGSIWVFRIKRNADGSVDNTRLVSLSKVSLKSTESIISTLLARSKAYQLPEVKLALATRHDREVESFCFNGVYLNGKLDDDEAMYMQNPPGYDAGSATSVLYELTQVRRKWYDVLYRILTELGFRISNADPGVSQARIGQDILILAIHVDDCAMTGAPVSTSRSTSTSTMSSTRSRI